VKKEAGLTESDVLAHCDGKLARFKLPRGAVFVDEIPRNPSGKILKRVLREQFPGPAPE
jgi:acyl-CoA synthetase (AMP-forming)/AMP-acid ligase II